MVLSHVPPTLPKEPRLSFWWGVAVLLACAALVRMVRWRFFSGALEIEGSEYARIAENLLAGKGYVGLLDGKELMLPPLMSMATALVSFLSGLEPAFSCRFVSLASSLVAIVVAADLGKRIWNERVGLIAAFLFGFAPLLVLSGTAAFSEMLQVCLLLLAMRAAIDALNGNIIATFACGITLGFAYLARIESLPAAALTILVISVARLRQSGKAAGLTCLCLLTLSFLLGALPYALYVHEQTGSVSVAGKAARVFLTIERFAAGQELGEANYAIAADGTPEGPWLSPNAPYDGPDALTILRRSTGSVLGHMARNAAEVSFQLLSGKGLSSVFLLMFAGFALRDHIKRREIWIPLLLLGVAAGSFAMAILYKVLLRYSLTLSIPIFLLAARGCDLWLLKHRGTTRPKIAALPALAYFSLFGIVFLGPGEFREGFESNRGMLQATQVLRDHAKGVPSLRLMASDSRLPHLCGPDWTWIPLPHARSPEAFFQFARSTQASFVVLSTSDERTRIAAWANQMGEQTHWDLVGRVESHGLSVYRLRPLR